MSNEIYPNAVRGLTWTVTRSPEFSTIVQSSPSLHETTIIQASNPRWHWELDYDYLKDNASDLAPGLTYTDFQTLLAFFLKHYGQGDSFLFSDTQTPDYHIGPAMIAGSPNLEAQLPLVQSSLSGNWYSPLQVKRAGGAFWEDIDYLNGSINVYANGVFKSAAYYSIGGPGLAIPGASYAGMYIAWAGEQTPPITAQFDYCWRVRFESDRQDFEKFLSMLWSAGGRGGASIKLKSARAYTPAASI